MWFLILFPIYSFVVGVHSHQLPPPPIPPPSGKIQVMQPLTYGAALQAEVQRMQSLNQVFPPTNLSYFVPYGDRTVVATQFPTIITSHAPPNSHSHSNGDFGVIISQNYLYRQNLRDYGNFAKIFTNTRPSQEILMEVGKLLAMSVKDNRKSASSFVLVMIESRVKVSGHNKGHLSLTNGSVMFPTPSKPHMLTFVPFTLRESGDVMDVFKGYENDVRGLVPQEKKQLLGFLKLVDGIHQDTHHDGKERLGRVRRLSSTFTKPRLPVTNLLLDDPLEAQEDGVKDTYWLYSSTVALRTASFLSGQGGTGSSKASANNYGAAPAAQIADLSTEFHELKNAGNLGLQVDTAPPLPPLHSDSAGFSHYKANTANGVYSTIF